MKSFVLKSITALLLSTILAATAYASLSAAVVLVAPQFGPRSPVTQQTTYIRVHAKILGGGTIVVNGHACTVATTGTCVVKFGAIPANSFLLRQTQQIVTGFNSTTSDVIGVGDEKATGVNIAAAADVQAGAGAISSLSFVAGSSGTLLTTGVAQTGANGGYDLYMSYTWVGATAATAGEVLYVLEYAGPNDGDCVSTPMGSVPVSC